MAILTVYTKLLNKTLDGARIIDMGSTKTCQCFVLPYDEIQSCKKDLEGKFAFYILLGSKKNASGELPAYIGQTNDFITRVADHKAKKDWWDSALVFVSKANEIYKSEVEYLEYLGWKKAVDAKQFFIKNAKPIKEPKISDDKRNDMELFFEEIEFLTLFYGCNIFVKKLAQNPFVAAGVYEIFSLSMPKRNIEAKVKFFPDSKTYVLLKDSTISAYDTPSCGKAAQKVRAKLVQDSDLCKYEGNLIRILADTNIPVDSGKPSTPASVITGTSTQGTTAFKNKDDKTFDELFPNI